MKIPGLLAASALLSFAFFASGCVTHEREVVHDTTASGSYAEGYKEGYYDREHNRYWHEHAWVVCVDDDPHCR
ncbi:MAG: hypothetical protein JSR36_03210 [Proteobacteria bacterium]|nr:hypothetical protein [Pseudomonadota bacterium]